jgi:hypothetical protein
MKRLAARLPNYLTLIRFKMFCHMAKVVFNSAI